MSIYAMLTVDLNESVSTEARRKFAEHLAKENWAKRPLTTTWTASFSSAFQAQSVIETAKEDVAAAAALAGIKNYEAAIAISDTPPTMWKIGA